MKKPYEKSKQLNYYFVLKSGITQQFGIRSCLKNKKERGEKPPKRLKTEEEAEASGTQEITIPNEFLCAVVNKAHYPDGSRVVLFDDFDSPLASPELNKGEKASKTRSIVIKDSGVTESKLPFPFSAPWITYHVRDGSLIKAELRTWLARGEDTDLLFFPFVFQGCGLFNLQDAGQKVKEVARGLDWLVRCFIRTPSHPKSRVSYQT